MESEFSVVQIGLWGAAGAAASLVLTYVIPVGLLLAKGKASLTISLGRIVGAALVFFGTLSLGALVAVVWSGDVKSALAYGLAYQGTLTGAIEGLKES